MKITHLALIGIALLVVAAGGLLLDTANDKRFAAQQVRLDEMNAMLHKLSKPAPAPEVAPVAPAPIPAPAPAVSAVPAPLNSAPVKMGLPPATGHATAPDPAQPNPSTSLSVAAQEKQLLDEEFAKLKDTTESTQYSPIQLKIKNLPAIAKIKNYNTELSFVELDAGKNRNLEKGMTFNIRRAAMLVGKVTVSDTIEDNSCIADLDSRTVPVGIQIQPGDELVQYQ